MPPPNPMPITITSASSHVFIWMIMSINWSLFHFSFSSLTTVFYHDSSSNSISFHKRCWEISIMVTFYISGAFSLPEWFQENLLRFHLNCMNICHQLGPLFRGRQAKPKLSASQGICFRNRSTSTHERNPTSQQHIKLMSIKTRMCTPSCLPLHLLPATPSSLRRLI